MPLKIRKIANRHMMIPSPKIGMYKGCCWFLNDICIMDGPINISGRAYPNILIPLYSTSLLVDILERLIDD